MRILSGTAWGRTDASRVIWDKIMKSYSSAGLKKAKDKLATLADIAKKVNPVTDGEYDAGIWKECPVT